MPLELSAYDRNKSEFTLAGILYMDGSTVVANWAAGPTADSMKYIIEKQGIISSDGSGILTPKDGKKFFDALATSFVNSTNIIVREVTEKKPTWTTRKNPNKFEKIKKK